MSEQAFLTPHTIVQTYLDKSENEIPLYRQCELLGISKSSLYYQPASLSEEDISLMRLIDKIHTDFPTYGARTMAHQLTRDVGYVVGRKRAGTLMETMGIEAIYPKPNLSQNKTPHPIYPYLLHNIVIQSPNQVWGSDITYIRMKHGFMYLVAILDWYARYVIGWQLSDSLTTDFCLDTAQSALHKATPGIINVDQGVQFTDIDMIKLWLSHEVQISMDHKGRCFDNIFTERFWRTLKYEEVYLRDYQTAREAEQSIGAYIEKYNTRRLHQALQYRTPAEVYFGVSSSLQVNAGGVVIVK